MKKLWSCLNILPSAFLDLVLSLIREKRLCFNWWQKAEMFFYTALRSLYCPQISTLVITDKDWRFWTILINPTWFFKSLITSIRRCQLNDYVHALLFQYWKAVTFFWYLHVFLSDHSIRKQLFYLFRNLSINDNTA